MTRLLLPSPSVRRIHLLSIGMTLLLATTALHAQSVDFTSPLESKPNSIGIEMDGGVIFTERINRPGETNLFEETIKEKSKGTSLSTSLTLHLPLSNFLDVQLKTGFVNHKLSTPAYWIDNKIQVPETRDQHLRGMIAMRTNVQYVTTGALLQLNVAGPYFAIVAGPIAHIRTGDLTNSLIYTPAPSLSSTTPGSQPKQEVKELKLFSDEAAPKVRWGIAFGFEGHIPLFSTLSLVPKLQMQYMFTPMSRTPVSYNVVQGESAVNPVEYDELHTHGVQSSVGIEYRF